MKIKGIIKKIKNNEIDIVEHTIKTIEQCKILDEKYGYFNAISEELAISQAAEIKKQLKNKDSSIKNKKLLGVAISVKDGICVKGVETAAGSKILKGYFPLFDAFVIRRIKEEGGIIIGKTSQDEFGFGSFNVNVGIGFKIPKNPFDTQRSCGGSSGGAAGLAQKLENHIALGESTGGSIAVPAAFCGVIGLCPTYGRVSRHGLIDFGNSLDKIGTIGKNIEDAALLMSVMAGYDKNDSTSLNAKSEDFGEYLEKPAGGMKIGIIKEVFGEGVDSCIREKILKAVGMLEDSGIKVVEVSMEMPMKYGLPAYYMISASEASTNLAKFCGMRYGKSEKLEGNFNEYFTKVRSKNFGDEAKIRIILGTFARMAGYRDAFYLKAMKVRTLIISEYKKAFRNVDALVTPTTSMLPPKFSEIEKLTPLQHYLSDLMTVSPNVAGLPHLSIPVGFEKKLPIGMMLISDHLQEGKLIQLGGAVENLGSH